jgi:hypothetical protein
VLPQGPGAIDEAVVDLHALHCFLVGEVGHLAEPHGIHLHGGIERGVECAKHRMLDRLPRHGGAVPAHEHDLLVGERLGERRPELRG